MNLSENESTPVPQYPDYQVSDLQVCQLPFYNLTYALYNKKSVS